jgi:hypothetical protein
MSDVAAVATMILLPVVSLFFWVRGIVRANKGDLMAGLGILLGTCSAILLIVPSSAAFTDVGCILIVYGAGTYVASCFARDNRLFKRRELVVSAVLFVVVGFCGLIII